MAFDEDYPLTHIGWHLFVLLTLSISLWTPHAIALSRNPLAQQETLHLHPITGHTFSKPLFLTTAPGQADRVYIVEQDGRVLVLHHDSDTPTLFLDISTKLSTGGERGLLGLAFHPHYDKNGRLFLNYTRREDRATVLAEYHAPANQSHDQKESILLIIPQPYGNHNGGMIAFGPDHFLYVGTGDGGAAGDPENRAQNVDELLGKFLRIDVDGKTPYDIPPGNPFIKGKGKPEIYAVGLRNPWRFSFDRDTGELWAGDVGQNAWEEIDLIQKGGNYGWRFMEGNHCYHPRQNCKTRPDLTLPKTEYRHEDGRCSVTGGYVYRGQNIPQLRGTYLFGDFCTGEIWGFKDGQTQLLLDTDLQISSFGEDTQGEIVVVGHGGTIFKIVPTRN